MTMTPSKQTPGGSAGTAMALLSAASEANNGDIAGWCCRVLMFAPYMKRR